MSKLPATDPIAAEIKAEISDHLATAAEQLASQGVAADEARQRSEEKFGDPFAIGRRCYWIRQGDTLMFRTVIIVLLVALCLALGVAAISSWQTQRQMANQMAALAEQLKALAEQQKALPTVAPSSPAEPKPLEITGRVFLGPADKPSANTEVMICRVSDGEIVRRTMTSDRGLFQSGPLTPGDYAVVADGVKHSSWQGTIGIQTAPIYLYPGTSPPKVTIDAAYRAGRIGAKLSRPLPKLKVDGKYVIDSRLYLTVSPSSSSLRARRWTVAESAPEHWPIYIRDVKSAPPPQHPSADYLPPNTNSRIVLSNEDIESSTAIEFAQGLNPLPAGPCAVRALVVADVVPDGPLDLDGMIWSRRSGYRPSDADRQWMSKYWAVNETLGQVWLMTLGKQRFPKVPYTSLQSLNHQYLGADGPGPAAEVLIADGCLTSLLIEVPDDVVSRIQQLVETVTEPDQFKEIVSKERPFVRSAKITVLSTEPLPAGESKTGASEPADR
jgi:hypothetical protein